MAENPIFGEYIGSGPTTTLSAFPGEKINPKISEFHFMLAFAVDVYSNGNGMGTFKSAWDKQSFSRDDMDKLKNEHKNVKVVISIGGRGPTYPFNPKPDEKQRWIDNAEKSLKAIIDRYNPFIDGIDVNYEYINTTITSEDFSHCLGQLLRRLVNKKLIKVVSISPSDSVLSHYTKLFNDYKDIINWVNYQFYNENLTSKKEFEDRVSLLRGIFSTEKLLAGYSTDPNDKGMITSDDFFRGCEDLIRSKQLHGIFIWNANYSAEDVPPFYFEEKAQDILTGSASTA